MHAVSDQLRRELGEALKSRDMVALSALRSALGAIDNASAVPAAPAPAISASSPHFAGATAGVGATCAGRLRREADVLVAALAAEL